MSASQSNLSDPKYGYDLAVAVTQASVNATMTEFLAGVASPEAPEVMSCYVFDHSFNFVPIAYETLLADANGSDPFAVPDGANPATNQDLINLTAAHFAGAFKATIGLPDMPLGTIPPIVTLGAGTSAPVMFNLLCSEFQLTGFQYGPFPPRWMNQSQLTPANPTPWYFSATVYLNRSANLPPIVPPAVQARIVELMATVGPNAFSIQQLFLDLDTAILQSAPNIVGPISGTPIYQLMVETFMNTYFYELQQTGQPVLGYSVAVTTPLPATMQLGAISHECCALLGNGPIPTPAQLNATTLVYLGNAATTPPVPEPFTWNWVELSEVASFSGVQAVRRDIFLHFLMGLINMHTRDLCQNVSVSLTHHGDDYAISYASGRSASPAVFQPISPIGPPATDGFTNVLSLTFASGDHDDSEAADGFSSIHGDFFFTLRGTVAVSTNQIRITLTPTVTMGFNHHELGVNYDDLPKNDYYVKEQTVIFTLGVGQNGHLTVTETNTLVDTSATWKFDPGGVLGLFGLENDLQSGLTSFEEQFTGARDAAFATFVTAVTAEINAYHGWVFPGAGTFVLSHVAFSSSLDLITQLVYANPN